MDIQRKPNKLGALLKALLDEKSYSMRHLAKLTDIDTATISRIINGKRKANINHMQKFALALDVPVIKLMEVSGYHVEKEKEKSHSELEKSFQTLQKMLETTDLHQENFTMEKMEQQLAEYQEFSQTTAGKNIILNEFKQKLTTVGSIGPYIQNLKDMFQKYKNRKGTPYELALIGSSLLYFIFTIDVVPDYIFPVGYLDDALVVQLIMQVLKVR